jgi:ATP-dependent helicase/nuclease subunit B
MERFVACPFQHFVIHGLRLQERKLFRLGAPDIGQLFHAALSRLAGQLGERFGQLAVEQIRAFAASAVDELAPRLQSQILLSSGRYRYIAQKLKEIVAQAAVVLSEHARRSQFRPVGLEVAFGPGGTIPALHLPLEGGGSMEIIGRIDRVDAAETDNGVLLRVIDYKSSATQLRLEEVIFGLSLQMLTYMDVLITHSAVWLGREAQPAGVLYFHVHNPLLGASNRINADEARLLMLKRFKLKGLVLADEETVRLMDGQLDKGHSELLPVAIKKDGGFYGTSSVVSKEQWNVLRRSVRGTIKGIGKRIQFCSYKAVCQFDAQFEGNDYVKLNKTPKELIWDRLAAGGSDTASFTELNSFNDGKAAEGGGQLDNGQ